MLDCLTEIVLRGKKAKTEQPRIPSSQEKIVVFIAMIHFNFAVLTSYTKPL